MQWQNGRRGVDGWGRYTRRRKWYRDAELVEVSPSTEVTPPPTPVPKASAPVSPEANRKPVPTKHQPTTSVSTFSEPATEHGDTASVNSKDKDSLRSITILEEKDMSDGESVKSIKTPVRHRMPSTLKRRGTGTSQNSRMSVYSSRESDDDMSIASRPKVEEWGIGDDLRMGLE